MKKYILTLALLTAIFNFCSAQKRLILSNPSGIGRSDELIVIKRDDIKNMLSPDKPYLKIEEEGTRIFMQFDDINHDGVWDEAIFLYSFKPNETVNFTVSSTDKKQEGILVKAHVRQKRKLEDNSFGNNLEVDSIPANQSNTDFAKVKLPPFLTEGPAWENDKVGFRLYFDIRNGKDIWGKTTSRMMLDSVGVNPSVIYHNRADWGMDIYKVGSSLSAGALAINIKLKSGKDSLIRLGGKNMGKVIYQKIADGPLRAKFKLYYPEWQFAPGYSPISLSEEISIWGGQYFYQSEISLSGVPKKSQLVTGFANLYGVPSSVFNDEKTGTLYSYGLQSENKDNLGLAVMASKHEIVSSGKSSINEPDIKDSYLMLLNTPAKNSSSTFRFYAGWSASDPRFLTKDGFKAFLEEQSANYGEKIKMKWEY